MSTIHQKSSYNNLLLSNTINMSKSIDNEITQIIKNEYWKTTNIDYYEFKVAEAQFIELAYQLYETDKIDVIYSSLESHLAYWYQYNKISDMNYLTNIGIVIGFKTYDENIYNKVSEIGQKSKLFDYIIPNNTMTSKTGNSIFYNLRKEKQK